jgi:hypothetical protein
VRLWRLAVDGRDGSRQCLIYSLYRIFSFYL